MSGTWMYRGVIQPRLFDADSTTPQACPVPECQALRYPQQQKTPTCAHDRDRALGHHTSRPKQCLNTPRPEHDPIPF